MVGETQISQLKSVNSNHKTQRYIIDVYIIHSWQLHKNNAYRNQLNCLLGLTKFLNDRMN